MKKSTTTMNAAVNNTTQLTFQIEEVFARMLTSTTKSPKQKFSVSCCTRATKDHGMLLMISVAKDTSRRYTEKYVDSRHIPKIGNIITREINKLKTRVAKDLGLI